MVLDNAHSSLFILSRMPLWVPCWYGTKVGVPEQGPHVGAGLVPALLVYHPHWGAPTRAGTRPAPTWAFLVPSSYPFVRPFVVQAHNNRALAGANCWAPAR